jgi:maltose O-acetyltransferase
VLRDEIDAHPKVQAMRRGEPNVMPDWDFIPLLGRARERLAELNRMPVSDVPGRFKMLKEIFWHYPDEMNSMVEIPFSADFGFNISIGQRSFINFNCTLLDTYPITIGDDVMIGPMCLLSTSTHDLRFEARKVRNEKGELIGGIVVGKPIVIENGAWLGGMVTVMPGVTIGKRAVIGAGSVVTKSIPPDVLAYGNPCRVIRPIDNSDAH